MQIRIFFINDKAGLFRYYSNKNLIKYNLFATVKIKLFCVLKLDNNYH